MLDTLTHNPQQTVVINSITVIELKCDIGHYTDMFCNTFT